MPIKMVKNVKITKNVFGGFKTAECPYCGNRVTISNLKKGRRLT